MARLLEHTGPEPITFDDVVIQCRLDVDDHDTAERDLIERIVIPAARGLAEEETGAAIRQGIYSEHWASIPFASSAALTVGQAFELLSITRGVSADAQAILTDGVYLVHGGLETLLFSTPSRSWREILGNCPQGVMVTYRAGIDIDAHPSVRHYLLMAAAWAYRHRELLVLGQALNTLPDRYLLSLLAGIKVPPRI